MDRSEHEAGPNQAIVVYVSGDRGSALDPHEIFAEVASDAAARSRDGWRIVSTTAMPLRQLGTAGNIFFQSGGQYATQVAVAVAYARD